jgi:soluble lytic murein transglycosylase-like protein
VDAPTINAAAGVRDATALFDNGLNRISEALSGFRAEQQRGANQQVMLNALRFTDPKQYQEALASGAITGGVDPTAIDARTLAALGSRTSDLQSQRANNQRFDTNQYTFDRTRQLDTATDAARPAAARQFGISDPALAALQPEDQLRFAQGSRQLVGADLANEYNQFRNLTTKRDDRDRQEGLALAGELNDQAIDPVSGREVAATASSPGARAIADQALSRLFPNAYGAGSVADTTFGSMLQAESSGRQFTKDGKTVTSPKGALGIAQIMPSTGPEAAALAGLPYDANRLKNDAQYNATLGKAYFDKQMETFGGDPAKAAAAYNAGPGATQKAIAEAAAEGNPDAWLSKLPKETQNYVPKVTRGQVDAAAADLGVRQMQNVGQQGATTDLFSNLSNTDTVGTVADTLLESDFKGADRQYVIRALNDVVKRANTSPAQAGAILRRNISGASNNPFSGDFSGTTNLGGNIGFRDQGVEGDIRAQQTGINIDQALTNQNAGRIAASLSSAYEKAQQAGTELAQLVQASQSRPELARQIPRYQARAQRAQQALQALTDAQRTTPAYRAQREAANVPPEEVNRELNKPEVTPPTARVLTRRDLEFGLYD